MLSPVLFNIVLGQVASAVLHNPTTVSVTFYAEDVCIWASGDSIKTLQLQLQSAIDRLNRSLGEIGLNIAARKSRFMLFSGAGQRTKQVYAAWDSLPIQRTREDRFLGVVFNSRQNGVAHVRATLVPIRSSADAIKCLCCTRWGSSPPALLHLHQSLVVSR